MLQNKFLVELLKKYFPLRKYNILFSGGVDSLAVAHFLSVGKKNKVVLWHFNHGLDGDDLIVDKCREFARIYNIEIKIVSNTHSNTRNKSIEHFCRDARYSHFDKIGGNFIACHHLDDAVENYIANCMGGHPEYKPIPEVLTLANSNFVRPFLLTKKEEFIKYCEKQGLNNFIAHDPFTAKSRRFHIRNAIAELKKGNLIAYKTARKFYEKNLDRK